MSPQPTEPGVRQTGVFHRQRAQPVPLSIISEGGRYMPRASHPARQSVLLGSPLITHRAVTPNVPMAAGPSKRKPPARHSVGVDPLHGRKNCLDNVMSLSVIS